MDKHHSLDDVSVILIAGAEEHNIRSCLETVAWAGEIIVVHSMLVDRTAEIAREFTPHVFYKPFEGYAKQKRAALERAGRDWVFSIDADERATPELQREIAEVLAGNPVADGFYVPRKSFFHGKWIRHMGWYPDYQLRLLRREKTTVTERLVHEGFVVNGERRHLASPLLHFTIPNVRHMLEKNLDYARLEAEEKMTRRNVGVLDVILRPPIAFIQKFVFQQGFRDGWEGLVLSSIHALNKLQVQLYMWEMQRPVSTPVER